MVVNVEEVDIFVIISDASLVVDCLVVVLVLVMVLAVLVVSEM